MHKTKKARSKKDYPLASERPDLVKTLSSSDLSGITLQNVLFGQIDFQEIRISSQNQVFQAQVANFHGRSELGANFQKAAELAHIPDEEVLRIYNALRPHQATKEDLVKDRCRS